MRNVFHKTIGYFNLFFALCLLASALSPFISPEILWIAPFLGLFFPLLVLINVLWVLYWSFMQKPAILISVIALLTVSGQIKRFVNIPPNLPAAATNDSPSGKDTFRILSYNVRAFNLYDWAHNPGAARGILDYVANSHADIFCFQEFYSRAESRLALKDIPLRTSFAPHAYFYYYYTDYQGGRYGIATYSKYPILRKGAIKFENTYNVCIYTDILVNSDSLRIYNAHLQSVKFRKANYDFLDTLRLAYSERHLKEIKDIYGRLKTAYLKRAGQVQQIAQHILECPYKVIVCGDLNDTPVSYTYKLIKGNLADAFTEAGRGFGYTYNTTRWPFLRIDYIFSDKSFIPLSYKTERIPFSDHFPVYAVWINR